MYKRRFDPNHIENTSCQTINNLCQPLKDVFGLNYFSLQRYYFDLKAFALSNRSDWSQYYYDNQLYLHIDQLPDFIHHKIVFVDDYPKASSCYQYLIQPLKELFDISHITLIPFFNPCHVEIIVLGAPSKTEFFERSIISHLDFIRHFLLYFKDKAAKIITEAKKQRFPISGFNKKKASLLDPILMESKIGLKSNDYLEQMTLKRYYLTGLNDTLYFTQREMDCIKLLLRGFRYTKIADELNLSYKTIYEYIENIKAKLACKTKQAFLTRIQQIEVLQEDMQALDFMKFKQHLNQQLMNLYPEYLKDKML